MTPRVAIRIPWNGNVVRHDIVEILRLADDAGFHSGWMGDHVVYPLETTAYNDTAPGGYPAAAMRMPTYEALSMLAFAAAASERTRIGVGCLVLPQRSPLIVAKQLATIDQLSDGRVVLGAVAGWLEEEFDALGVDFAQRRGRLEEGVALMRHCWETDQPSWRGTHWSFPPVNFAPKPRQSPLPVWFGGHAPASLRRAANLGDGWYGSRLAPAAVAPWVRTVRELRATSPRAAEPFTVMVSAPPPPPGTPHEPTPGEIRDIMAQYDDIGADVVLFDTNVADSAAVLALARVVADAVS